MIKLAALLFAIAILGITVAYDLNTQPAGTPLETAGTAETFENFETAGTAGTAGTAETAGAAQETAPSGLPTPDFAFETMEGTALELSALSHEEILVHFWAGWCTTCFAEFPGLLDYITRQEGKAALLAIAIDEELPPAQKFMTRLKATKGVNLDQENVFWIWDEGKDISLKTFNTTRVPETIIIKNGMMVDKHIGPHDW